MNKRNQAIETLKEARDLIAGQLTEQILECREEILDDAAGDSFMGEIEQIYEKFGNRLSHLSSLISSLPAVIPGLAEQSTDARPAAPEAKPESNEETLAGELANEFEIDESEPAVDSASGAEQSEPVTFETFITQLRSADIEGAGTTLGVLLGVGTDRGVRCASQFAEKLVADPTVMLKAMNLRTELQANHTNASMMLLFECFGLRGLESITAIETLRASLASSA